MEEGEKARFWNKHRGRCHALGQPNSLINADHYTIPPVELVVFLCYSRSMKETKELDQDIFKEVMKIWRQEQAKMYWREVKSINKKKDLRRKKKIANVLR